MQSLLKFISRYRLFLLFICAQIFCLYLIVSQYGLNYQRVKILSTANQVTGKLFEYKSFLTEYFHLREINDSLAIENSSLKELTKNSLRNVQREIIVVNDTLYKIQYRYQKAKVIQSTYHLSQNFITIDQGSNQGIEPEMAVISANGIVGKTIKVSKNYAVVESALHEKFSTTVKVKRTNHFGRLQWNNESYHSAKVVDITREAPLKKGDLFVTREGSSIFPEGIPVGIIESISSNEGDNFHDIMIRLNTDFTNLSYVYVVRNLQKDEIQSLQTEYYND